MNKADVLAKITDLARNGELTEQELIDAFRGSSGGPSRWLSPTLGFVGSALVAAALLIFINTQHVGSGYGAAISGTIAGLAYALGAVNARSENGKPLSEPLLFMAGLVVPMLLVFGSIVLGFDPLAVGLQAVLGGIGCVPFLATGLGLKSSTSIVLASLYAGWGVTALCAWAGESTGANSLIAGNYGLLVAGAAMVALAYGLEKTEHRNTFGILAVLGCTAALWAGIWLCEWGQDANPIWIIVFPIMAFGVLIWGATERLRGFVIAGSLALFAYQMLLTGLLFPDSAAWPAAVALIGGVLLAIAIYVSHRARIDVPTPGSDSAIAERESVD